MKQKFILFLPGYLKAQSCMRLQSAVTISHVPLRPQQEPIESNYFFRICLQAPHFLKLLFAHVPPGSMLHTRYMKFPKVRGALLAGPPKIRILLSRVLYYNRVPIFGNPYIAQHSRCKPCSSLVEGDNDPDPNRLLLNGGLNN